MTTNRCRARKGADFCTSRRCPQRIADWVDDRAYFVRTMVEREGWTEALSQSTLQLMEDLRAKYGFPLIGTSRAVFFTKDEVIKVPFTDRGINDSMRESYAHKRSLEQENFIPIAPCHFVEHGDRWLLHMARVKPLIKVNYKQLPDWVGFVDGGQVGYLPNGKLVAYDL